MILKEAQLATCNRFGANFDLPSLNQLVGISKDLFSGAIPVNGLRHPPKADTCGWYLWTGKELSRDADFFKPLHFVHLSDRLPRVLPYLALPPGWRFLLADDYEDVWFDESLLHI
jgi:hypothetical protein